MAMYDVYSHPEFRKYRASICSKATFFMIFIYIFVFIIPLLIVYRSNGFWVTTTTNLEQPDVSYKHKIITLVDVVDTATSNPSYIAWSTYPQFNSIHQANVRIPVVKSHEEDVNKDGKNDILYLDIEYPTLQTEQVHRFSILLFFQYKLKSRALITLEGMAHISSETTTPGAAFSAIGELRLKQRNAIPHKGVDTTYNTSIISEGSLIPADYDIATIFQSYSSRNMTTYFTSTYPVWTSGRPVDGVFTVSLQINYPEEIILFHTGFWQMIKLALVQYVAVLIIFAFLCERLKLFVFSHQIVNTVVIKANKQT